MKSDQVFQQVRKINPTRFSASGHLPFKKERSVPYESTLERDFLIYFSYLSDVKNIVSQPVRIPFVKNGVTYTYTPDFFVSFYDGRKSILVEVKPKFQWQKHWYEWRNKWKAAISFCKENDCIFHIYDEDRIRHLALFNLNFIQRYKYLQCEQEDLDAVLQQIHLMSGTTIGYLIARFFSGSLYRTRGLRIIYYLLATKQLTCNWFEPLNDSTEIWVYENNEEF